MLFLAIDVGCGSHLTFLTRLREDSVGLSHALIVVNECDVLKLVLGIELFECLGAKLDLRHWVLLVQVVVQELAEVVVDMHSVTIDFSKRKLLANARTSRHAAYKWRSLDLDSVEGTTFLLLNSFNFRFDVLACLSGLRVTQRSQESIRVPLVLRLILW